MANKGIIANNHGHIHHHLFIHAISEYTIVPQNGTNHAQPFLPAFL